MNTEKKLTEFQEIPVVKKVDFNEKQTWIVKFLSDSPAAIQSKFDDSKTTYRFDVKSENEHMFLWVSSWKLIKQLRQLQETEGLEGKTHRITRQGSGYETNYLVEAV